MATPLDTFSSQSEREQRRLAKERFSEKKLTLLHMAVMEGKETAVKRLLELGSNPSAVDDRLWTPLHHAAVKNDHSMIALLLENGANPDAVNDTGATYSDLLCMIQFLPSLEDEQIPVFFRDERGDEHQLSYAGFYKLRNAHFLEEALMNPDFLLKEWNAPPKEYQIFDVTRKYIDHYGEYSSHFPSHTIAKVSHNSEGTALFAPIGFGLFARQQIEAGEPIGEYLGYWGEEVLSDYSLSDGPDAFAYGNETSFINDGFPNICALSIPNYKGVPLRCLFVALEDIVPGEQMCFNYGKMSLKTEGYALLRTKEMEDFFKGEDLIKMVDDFALHLGNPHADLKTFSFVTKMRYVMQTPSALWWLILKEVIPYETSFQIVAGALYTGVVLKRNAKLFEDLLSVSRHVLDVKEEFKQKEPSLVDQFLSTFLELPERFPLEEALIHAKTLCSVYVETGEKHGK